MKLVFIFSPSLFFRLSLILVPLNSYLLKLPYLPKMREFLLLILEQPLQQQSFEDLSNNLWNKKQHKENALLSVIKKTILI